MQDIYQNTNEHIGPPTPEAWHKAIRNIPGIQYQKGDIYQTDRLHTRTHQYPIWFISARNKENTLELDAGIYAVLGVNPYDLIEAINSDPDFYKMIVSEIGNTLITILAKERREPVSSPIPWEVIEKMDPPAHIPEGTTFAVDLTMFVEFAEETINGLPLFRCLPVSTETLQETIRHNLLTKPTIPFEPMQ